MTCKENVKNEKQAENENYKKVAEVHKKYDDIIKTQFSVNYWPYWIISFIFTTISLYLLGVSDKSSILIGGIAGTVIALFWQKYTKKTKKKSQEYIDIQKQRSYAVKAQQNALLPESQAEGKADFNPAIRKPNFFQEPSFNKPKNIIITGKYPLKKKQNNNKWLMLFYIALVLSVFLIIVGNLEIFIKLYNSSPLTNSNDVPAELNKPLIIKQQQPLIKKNTGIYKADINLRHCLDLSTKEEVIHCSEQAK